MIVGQQSAEDLVQEQLAVYTVALNGVLPNQQQFLAHTIANMAATLQSGKSYNPDKYVAAAGDLYRRTFIMLNTPEETSDTPEELPENVLPFRGPDE